MATLKQLIESEIGDFFAGFGGPGEPETPEEMQSQLLARVMPLLAGLERGPIGYRSRGFEWAKGWTYFIDSSPSDFERQHLEIELLYAAPQLPQQEVVPSNELLSAMEEVMRISDRDHEAWHRARNGIAAFRAAMLQGAEPVSQHPYLTVWYGSMPETNGKSNWTAILHRKGEGIQDGITIDRSEYPGRVLYAADRVRYLIGEKPDRPFILNYDGDKHSGYVKPVSQPYTLRDGWVAVPFEPTPEMNKAGWAAMNEHDAIDPTYRAMLAAAPDFREISNSSTKHFRENAETSTKCWCLSCRPVTMNDARFVVCPDCGNKRCPHANDHRNACTESNEPGQEGSAYPAAPQQEVKS